jgi:hypothetical protein
VLQIRGINSTSEFIARQARQMTGGEREDLNAGPAEDVSSKKE